MVKISILDNYLLISIQGWHKVWALKSSIKIPLKNIENAKLNLGIKKYPTGLRIPGTNIYPFLVAGTYRGMKNEFWDVRHWNNSIIIETKGNYKYKQLILEVDNPQETVNLINTSIL
ncbi:MAG: hypothetical protein A3E87_06095 [Gammaproteobacteria bacterium RIFCSPHIGHO2_12_FULL_35_23]|nr:MAG: hypothetical protein A3E87_06095 [Gammaproteobacteria bacterium RIFCSPHIGHO2_12_FULL_35_23]